MIDERMTAEEMSKRYPNEWLFITAPKTRKNTTYLGSGGVQVHSKSRDDVYEASRKFKGEAAIDIDQYCANGDAAIRFTGDYTKRLCIDREL